MKEKKQFRISNKWIVILKIATACAMWLVASLFFFQSFEVFWVEDVNSTDVPPAEYFYPWPNLDVFIVPLLAILFVLAYVIFLINRIVDNKIHQADRFDLVYKIVFTLFLLYIAIRSPFLPPSDDAVPVHIVVLAVATGIFNWLIPGLVYYDDKEEF